MIEHITCTFATSSTDKRKFEYDQIDFSDK